MYLLRPSVHIAMITRCDFDAIEVVDGHTDFVQ